MTERPIADVRPIFAPLPRRLARQRDLEAQPGMKMLLDLTPIPRLGRVEEIVSVVDFLTSSASSYVTGTDVLVDGGAVSAVVGLQA